MPLEIVEKVRPVRFQAVRLEISNRKEKPWSIPTREGASSASRSTSHSAMPRRVQYLRALGGGITSTGGDARSAASMRRPFRLAVGVSAARIVDPDLAREGAHSRHRLEPLYS
jgi:hypothetical protein